MRFNLNDNTTLNDLRETIPSIFSNEPSPRVSSKYKFSSTHQLCEEVEKSGWKITSAYQTRYRNNNEVHKNYARHVISFSKQEAAQIEVDQLIPTLHIENSHNGSSSLKFYSGLHRVVCSNGLITPMKEFTNMNIRHSDNKISQVRSYLENYLENFDSLRDTVTSMYETTLTSEEVQKFTKYALELRFGKNPPMVEIEKLLSPKRNEDSSPTLWNTFNIVQEKLTTGEYLISKLNKKGNMVERKGREMKQPMRYMGFNANLWDLAKSKIEIGDFQLVN